MPNITQIPAPRVPIIEEKTGLMSREWYRFFINIFQLTGSGSNNVSLEDLQVAPPPMDFGEVKSLFVAASPTTSVQYNSAGAFAGNANFTYNAGTNTVTFGNLTGSALDMIVRLRAPDVTENAGSLVVEARNAAKVNSNGGSLDFRTGQGNGAGVAGTIYFRVGATSTLFQLDENTCSLSLPGNAQFLASDGGFSFLGGTLGGVGEIIFTAPINPGVTGNNPIRFATDSGDIFALSETTFGTQEIAFFGVTPVVKQTTSIATITRTAVGGGNAVDDNDTFGGYTIGQIVTALKAYGLLA